MTVREEARQRIEQDPELIRLRQKIASGKATYSDTAAYSNRAGKLVGEVFSRRLPEIPPEEREPLCVELLHDRYIDINAAVDAAQRYMDERIGIQIAPQHAPFNSDRAHQIGSATADPTVSEETQQRRARSATETATKAMHDDRMKSEADFRSRAGLKCYINRVAVNGCCPWCSKVAGRYEYGDEPDDIYRRHDNCDCTVTFDNGRKRQDVWSKREWEVPRKDAGADDAVVLTKEQAQALQEKHGLTYGRKPAIIKLPDIEIGRSVGAKAKNYDIVDPQTGEIFHLVEGSRITNAQVFAGKGTHSPLHEGVAEGLTEQYGGSVDEWRHAKGHGILDYYGDEIGAEIHWFEEPTVGRVKFKVKRWDE